MIRSLNICLAALLSLAAMCVAGPTRAQDGKKRVAVMTFQGPSAAAFQAQVSQGLKQRPEVELVAASEVKDTSSRLGNSLASEAEYREVGEALELSAFVEGEVVKIGRELRADVRVRDASSGAVVHEVTWTRKRSQVKALKGAVWGALGPGIAQTSPPQPKAKPKPAKPAKPAPVAETEAPKPRPRPARSADEDEEETADKPRRPGGRSVLHPALVASLGPRLMWRTLKYTGDTNFNSYKNEGGSPGFNLALSAQYYPGAHFSADWYSNLGLDFDFDYSLALKSKDRDGKKLDTTAYELGIGAIYRFPLGAFEPRVRVGYVKHVFDVDVPPETLLPAVDYSSIRFGAGIAVNIVDAFSVDVTLGYLYVISAGELEEPKYGEDVDTRGWEAGVGALWRIKGPYGLRLGLDYRRYAYDFGLSDSTMVQRLPRTGTDSYLRLTLAFVYSLAGVASP